MAAVQLHVETRGSGRALVLAHGFGGSARNWRPQVRTFSTRFRVVTYDARGHARSEAPAGAEAYREAAFVGDLARVVAACGDAQPVVGGLSFGAAVALRFAIAQPARARALILASLPAGAASGRGVSARAAAFADAIERDGLEAAGARFAWGPDSDLDERGAALVRQGFLEHPPHALAHTLREFLATLPAPAALAGALAATGLPTLVIAGEGDPGSVAASRALAAGAANAQLVVVPDAGHVVNLAQPAAFDAALARFLDGLTR
jgi:pimeloyl-ACP methyl ester carboxylesterase